MDLRYPSRRPRVRRAVIVLPSTFTLGNMFFGFWSIVSAARGNFTWAGWCIVLAGVMDMLDGRVARLSKTDSRFGAELDSLVDLLSFGVAPALLMYHLEFAAAGGLAWLLCFGYVVAAAVRLARYNVVAGSRGYTPYFVGLPSTAAGMLLAVFYPFSQTPWYAATLAAFNRQVLLVFLILVVSVLMVSNVRYPKLPPLGLRTWRGRVGLVFHTVLLAGGILVPEYFFFPLGVVYVIYGLGRAVILGPSERGEAPPVTRAGEGHDEAGPRLVARGEPRRPFRSEERTP